MHRFAARQREAAVRQETGPAEPEGDRYEGRIVVVDLGDLEHADSEFPGKSWLTYCLKNEETIGWSIEWQPDRRDDSNNDVAIMVFASENDALLLRTHRSKSWLPEVVKSYWRAFRYGKPFSPMAASQGKRCRKRLTCKHKVWQT